MPSLLVMFSFLFFSFCGTHLLSLLYLVYEGKNIGTRFIITYMTISFFYILSENSWSKTKEAYSYIHSLTHHKFKFLELKTSNDIIAGNGRVLKILFFYCVAMWWQLLDRPIYFWKSLNTMLVYSPHIDKNETI